MSVASVLGAYIPREAYHLQRYLLELGKYQVGCAVKIIYRQGVVAVIDMGDAVNSPKHRACFWACFWLFWTFVCLLIEAGSQVPYRWFE